MDYRPNLRAKIKKLLEENRKNLMTFSEAKHEQEKNN